MEEKIFKLDELRKEIKDYHNTIKKCKENNKIISALKWTSLTISGSFFVGLFLEYFNKNILTDLMYENLLFIPASNFYGIAIFGFLLLVLELFVYLENPISNIKGHIKYKKTIKKDINKMTREYEEILNLMTEDELLTGADLAVYKYKNQGLKNDLLEEFDKRVPNENRISRKLEYLNSIINEELPKGEVIKVSKKEELIIKTG